MGDWSIVVNDFHVTDKLVSEFRVYSSRTGNFIVRIYESRQGDSYTGFTNLKIKSLLDDSPEGGVGHGKSIVEALEDTLKYLNDVVIGERDIKDEDIEYVDYDGF